MYKGESMKKYVLFFVVAFIGSLQAEIRIGNYVIWGTRYDRSKAFVDRLKKQYPAQFALMDKVSQEETLSTEEKRAVAQFAAVLKRRMNRFDLVEDLRPYAFWCLVLMFVLWFLFAARQVIRSRKQV